MRPGVGYGQTRTLFKTNKMGGDVLESVSESAGFGFVGSISLRAMMSKLIKSDTMRQPIHSKNMAGVLGNDNHKRSSCTMAIHTRQAG